MGFRGHGLPLYLDKHLYLGLIKLQSDKSLGKSYAGLLVFVEGLHHMGYLSQKQYELHKKRYSVPLNRDPEQVMLEEVDAANERKKLSKMFAQVIEQWSLHPDQDWRRTWLAKAKQHGEIPNAKRLLVFVEEHRSGDV